MAEIDPSLVQPLARALADVQVLRGLLRQGLGLVRRLDLDGGLTAPGLDLAAAPARDAGSSGAGSFGAGYRVLGSPPGSASTEYGFDCASGASSSVAMNIMLFGMFSTSSVRCSPQ